jgi:hypothetical protein
MLGVARDAYERLRATWERARTELDMAEALAVDRTDEARVLVEAAAPDLDRVGAMLELERLRALRERVD